MHQSQGQRHSQAQKQLPQKDEVDPLAVAGELVGAALQPAAGAFPEGEQEEGAGEGAGAGGGAIPSQSQRAVPGLAQMQTKKHLPVMTPAGYWNLKMRFLKLAQIPPLLGGVQAEAEAEGGVGGVAGVEGGVAVH